MKTGFARHCITPPLGVSISGYYEARQVKGVLDDLYVSAISFDNGQKKAIIITVDVIFFSTKHCLEYKKVISTETGLEENSIFINCSHTHTGPVVGPEDFSGAKGNPAYNKALEKALIAVAKDAFLNMEESEFSFAQDLCEGISFCRRYRMKDGTVQTNPGVDNPNIDHPLAQPNPAVKLLQIKRRDGQNYLLVNFGTHADTVGGELISADWPGFIRSTLEKALDNTKCLFLLGTQGDVNHVNPTPTASERVGLIYDTFDGVPRSYEHARYMGRKVAGRVLGMIDKCLPLTADDIKFGTLKVEIPANQENDKLAESEKILALYNEGRANELPYENMELTTVVAEALRVVELQNGPAAFPFILSALKLGDFTLAGFPGECFVDIGRTIEMNNKNEFIFVCCLTNGGDSYFPTSIAYSEGGYETRTSRLKVGGDLILVDGMKRLTDSL